MKGGKREFVCKKTGRLISSPFERQISLRTIAPSKHACARTMSSYPLRGQTLIPKCAFKKFHSSHECCDVHINGPTVTVHRRMVATHRTSDHKYFIFLFCQCCRLLTPIVIFVVILRGMCPPNDSAVNTRKNACECQL